MSSSSESDEENTIEETNLESIVSKNDGTKLEAGLESLQVKETVNKDEPSTTAEGIIVKKKSSTRNIPANESAKNLDRAEAVGNKDSSTELSLKQNTSNYSFVIRREIQPKNEKGVPQTLREKDLLKLQAREEDNTSGAYTPQWRSHSMQDSARERKEYNSVSQSQSWRDPNFKYERSSSSRRGNIDESNSRQGRLSSWSRSFEDTQTHVTTFAKNRDMSKRGNWILTCSPDIILDNGLTEVEHVRNCVKELYEQNSKLFASHQPSEFKTSKGIKISCYTSNYDDKSHVAKVADVLIDKIRDYPYCFYYHYNNSPIYMRTYEKELYELTEHNYKLIDFNE